MFAWVESVRQPAVHKNARIVHKYADAVNEQSFLGGLPGYSRAIYLAAHPESLNSRRTHMQCVIDARSIPDIGCACCSSRSPIFTAGVSRLLSDAEYAALQVYLAAHPDHGALIPQTGGLRKIRWSAGRRGKRGGVRVIYCYVAARDQIRMILIYSKGVKDDLSASEKAVLRKLNESWER